jgi:hypothetical protein
MLFPGDREPGKETLAMKKGIFVTSFLLGSLVLSLIALAGCTSSQPPQSSTNVHVVSLDASWAKLYHSITDLKQAADLVVQGTVTQVQQTVSSTDGTPPSTDFLFTVSKVLQDPAHRLHGTTLTLHQTGELVGNTLYQVDDDPLFQTGEQSILFLHEYQPGFYFVIGGPSGRFVIQKGTVKPINAEGVPYGGGSLNSFLTQVHSS